MASIYPCNVHGRLPRRTICCNRSIVRWDVQSVESLLSHPTRAWAGEFVRCPVCIPRGTAVQAGIWKSPARCPIADSERSERNAKDPGLPWCLGAEFVFLLLPGRCCHRWRWVLPFPVCCDMRHERILTSQGGRWSI